MNACEFQQAVLTAARQKARSRDNWVEELGSVIHKSKFTIYKKLRGDLQLSLEEIIAIKEHYEIDIDPILGSKEAFGSILLTTGIDIPSAAESLLYELERISRIHDARLVLNSSLLLHLCKFPALALLFLVARRGVKAFGDSLECTDLLRHRIILVLKRIHLEFSQIHTTEYWDPEVVALICDTVRACRHFHLLHETGYGHGPDLLCLFEAYMDTLFTSGIKPVAGVGTRNTEAEIHFAQLRDEMPFCVMESSSQQYLYSGNWLGLMSRTNDPVLVGVAREKLEQLGRSADNGPAPYRSLNPAGANSGVAL